MSLAEQTRHDARYVGDEGVGAIGAQAGDLSKQRQPEIIRLMVELTEGCAALEEAAAKLIDRIGPVLSTKVEESGSKASGELRGAPITALGTAHGAALNKLSDHINGITMRLRDARYRVEL